MNLRLWILLILLMIWLVPIASPVHAATSGEVVAWGSNNYGQTNVPVTAQSGVTAIAAGEEHTVALKNDGSVVAWGWNDYGQTIVPVAAQSGVVAITAGSYHTVALKTNGSVVAWGDNGIGLTNVPVAAQSGVMAIAAGWYHAVALKTNGSVVAWGDNGSGQTTVPLTAQSGVVAIAAGWTHTVALKNDGSVLAWGRNDYGGTDVPVTAQSGVVAIAAGHDHTVALKNDGSIVAWGAGTNNTGNNPNFGQSLVPFAAQSGVTAIAAGATHTVALKNTGLVLAWGYNGSGQTNVPAGLSRVTAIAAGWGHTLALLGTGGVAPSITTPPASQTNAAAATATFTVTAAGDGALAYQWLKNGAALPDGGHVFGGGTATLVISNASALDAAGYSVVVTNAYGAVTSSVATLSLALPAGFVAADGATFTENFNSMGTNGTNTPFGWFVGTGTGAISGTNVAVSTGSSTTGTNYNFGSSGSSDRALGSLASASTQRDTELRLVNTSGALITALILTYTGEQWRQGGSTATNNDLVLQFSTNGTAFTALGAAFNFSTPYDTGTAGALDGNQSTNRVTISGVTYTPAKPLANGQIFYLRWADADDAGTDHGIAIDDVSIGFTLSNAAPVILTPPQSQTIAAGGNATFAVVAVGGGTLGYQWQRNGTNLADGGNISGATASVLNLANVQSADVGSYTVTVTNNGGSVTSAAATLTVTGLNTAPTDIALSTASVAENRASGTVVGSLTATDADAGDTATFTLVTGAGDTDNASFAINGTNLVTAAVFDYETKANYSIRIRATDNGGLFFEKQFTIAVEDVNEPPTITLEVPAGVTWAVWESNRQWQAVASSADGTKLVAAVEFGQLYTSTNSGVTWTARESSRQWQTVASSADGTKLVAVEYYGQIYTSPDSGATWIARTNAIFLGRASVASSADGVKLVAVGNNDILTSTDSGVTWTAWTPNPWDEFIEGQCVASSADGTKLVAVNRIGRIYTSTDSGASWTAQRTNASVGWQSVASSADGTKLVAADDFRIYTSIDSGTNWVEQTSVGYHPWASVASSADGVKLLAVAKPGQIYTSTDMGVTWTARESNRRWRSAAISAGGNKLVAVVRDGQIYTSATEPPSSFAINEDAGPQAVNLIGITSGPTNENSQNLTITAISSNTSLILNPTVIYTNANTTGSITFAPATNAIGTTIITVIVRDSGGTANGGVDAVTNTFMVTVNAVNDAPTDIALSATSVAENRASGTVVGSLTATDADAGDTATFTLVTGTGSTDNASFAINGTNLITAAVFDYETKTNYSIRVRVMDSGGLFFEKQFTIAVTDLPDTPPSITAQPQSVTNAIGSVVNFTVTASGSPPLDYQWFFSSNSIPDATNSTLTLTNVARSNSGYYSVTVTNSVGSVTSSNALLVVGGAVQRILPLTRLGGGHYQFSFADADGGPLFDWDAGNLEVQGATNMSATNWVTLTNAIIITNGTGQVEFTVTNNPPQQFYRIRMR